VGSEGSLGLSSLILLFKIEKQFSFIFLKLKNTKNHFFVSGTTKPAHKAMHVSFALILFI
jgi:hypothetical protein